MYPFVRLAKELIRHRNAPSLDLLGEHRTTIVCWPWDIDPWLELNNGRTLTLNDLSRIVLFRRLGVISVMRKHGWAGAVAGASVRYRHRVRLFDRLELRARVIGWDARFVYAEQSAWRGQTCTSHVLLRMAISTRGGLVPTADLAAALGADPASPPLPGWVQGWIEAEAQRPWPPMQPPMQPPPGRDSPAAGAWAANAPR